MPKTRRLLYGLALIKFILPFILQNSWYQPQRDEFLYLAEGHHLAWGYMEVPPLLSVLSSITHAFGDGFFWIKCWPSLFGAFTLILTGEIILSLGGQAFALLLAFLSFVFTGFLRTHYLFQANFLEIFFWTLMAYGLIRYFQSGKKQWIYLFGISTGLGMMSKYSVAFFLVSVLMGLALSKERKIFANKHLYYAALIGFVVFLPNLLWQYFHHFPLLYHMKELQIKQLQFVDPLNFLTGQLMMLLPCVVIWVAGLFWVSFSRSELNYRFLGWAYVFLILLLLIGHGKSYYASGIYPSLLAFGAYQWEKFTSVRFKLLRIIPVIIPLALAFWLIPIALPILPPQKLASFYKKANLGNLGILKWEDQKNHALPMDFADMLSWKEMTEKTAQAFKSLDSNERKQCLLFCDNYGEAGAVNYYGKPYGLPEAFSDDASFLYWMPDSLHIVNMVYVTDDQNEMQHSFVNNFSFAKVFDSITDPYARERGSLIIIFKGANAEFNRMFNQKIAADKALGHQ
jgi:4-amino-4-deoxy-L-arabinose transferase-like glycosyltransferase